MPSRRLTNDELAKATAILKDVRQRILGEANDDRVLAFALRRYVYRKLSHDERGTPAQRTKLKFEKLLEHRSA